MKIFIKILLYFICCAYLLLGFFFYSSAATCREKYLDSIGQCATDCANLGTGFQSDTAADLCTNGQVCCHKTASTSGVVSKLELEIPLFDYAKAANLPEYILNIYRYALILIIPLSILMIIIGGIMWISAAGNQGNIAKAKSYIFSALIGLAIALFSFIFLSLAGIETLKMPGIDKNQTEIDKSL